MNLNELFSLTLLTVYPRDVEDGANVNVGKERAMTSTVRTVLSAVPLATDPLGTRGEGADPFARARAIPALETGREDFLTVEALAVVPAEEGMIDESLIR